MMDINLDAGEGVAGEARLLEYATRVNVVIVSTLAGAVRPERTKYE